MRKLLLIMAGAILALFYFSVARAQDTTATPYEYTPDEVAENQGAVAYWYAWGYNYAFGHFPATFAELKEHGLPLRGFYSPHTGAEINFDDGSLDFNGDMTYAVTGGGVEIQIQTTKGVVVLPSTLSRTNECGAMFCCDIGICKDKCWNVCDDNDAACKILQWMMWLSFETHQCRYGYRPVDEQAWYASGFAPIDANWHELAPNMDIKLIYGKCELKKARVICCQPCMKATPCAVAQPCAKATPCAVEQPCGKCNTCKQNTCSTCKPKCESKCNTCAPKPKCNTCAPKPKCNTCAAKPKCNTCAAKPKCNTCAAKPKCEPKCTECKVVAQPQCEPKCNTCAPKPKCNTCAAKPKCNTCAAKPKCNTCAAKPKCNTCAAASAPAPCATACDTGCAKPSACDAWVQYSGCEMVTSLCISITASEGTTGPLQLLLRDPAYQKLALIDLPGPIDGYYSYTYTFDTPVKASDLTEAVLINDGDDPATITSLRVIGMDEASFSHTYVDHTCPGMVLGQGGSARMVVF